MTDKPKSAGSLLAFLFDPEARAKAEASYAKALAEVDAEQDREIAVRFVKLGDPISDADREAYAKWCEGEEERQELIRKNSEAERLAYLKWSELDEQAEKDAGRIN